MQQESQAHETLTVHGVLVEDRKKADFGIIAT